MNKEQLSERIDKGREFLLALILLKKKGITHLVTDSDDDEIEHSVFNIDKFINTVSEHLLELNTRLEKLEKEGDE